MLFHELSKKARPTNEERGIRLLNKAKDAQEAAELLAKTSERVRDHIESGTSPKKRPAAAGRGSAAKKLKPTPASTTTTTTEVAPAAAAADKAVVEAPQPVAAAASAAPTAPDKEAAVGAVVGAPPLAAGNDAMNAAAAAAPMEVEEAQSDPRSLIGKRIAKEFDEGVFFGSIEEYLPAGSVDDADVEMWSVKYDDEDEEDLPKEDIMEMLSLYAKEKHNDTGR